MILCSKSQIQVESCQLQVLKGEVRRLENMLGNDNTNIEYLKNIVMKVN